MNRPLSFKLFFVVFLLSRSALGMSVNPSATCEQTFAGTVARVVESKTPFSPHQLAKLSVVFDLHGGGEKTIEVLRNGPVQFEQGQAYSVKMRQEWLCSVSKISQH